jgi:peptidoglycan/xylan/chitin deacetylase (PgdA/CDA1 family)
VALTFDDGPAPSVTARLVETLQELAVPATFFMVGQRVAASPGTARLVETSGFLTANHSYRHEDMTRQSMAQIRATIRDTDKAFRGAGVHPTNLMRPPYGAVDPHVYAAIRTTHEVAVLWDVDPRDWAGGSGAQIAARVLGQLHPHGRNIVLMHDGVANSPHSVDAVPRIVSEARRRGYCFVALDERGQPGFPTPAARLTVSPGDRHVREGGQLRLTVSLSQPAGRATSVRLKLKGRTASLTQDVTRPEPLLRIPAGALSAVVSVPVLRDDLDEPTERFRVRLVRPDGVRLEGRPVNVVVEDDDPPPAVSGEATAATEPASGSVAVPVTFRLDRPSAKQITLVVQTVAGSADGSDFTPVSATLTIPAGGRTGHVTVSVLADAVDEPPETFSVHVSHADNARVAVADAVVTINPPTP